MHRDVRHEWNLAPLKLTPGSILTFHAEAIDFDNLEGPNLGKSRELRLRIVTDEDITRQLDDERREIRDETARILAMQKQAAVPVEDALRKLAKADNLARAERDDLKNAEMIQRQVGNRINNRTDGLDQKIKRFLDDLRNFKIPNADAQKQMEQMRAGVERIREEHLGPAEQGLTHASKSLAESQDDASPSLQPAPGDRPEKAPAGPPKERAQGQPKEQAKTNPPAGMKKEGEAASKEEAGAPDTPKSTGGPAPNHPLENAKDALTEAKANQKAIADELQKMLDGLSEFETYQAVVKDAQGAAQGTRAGDEAGRRCREQA